MIKADRSRFRAVAYSATALFDTKSLSPGKITLPTFKL